MDTPHVLLTGSTGFIGRHVARALHEAGFRVTALDYRPPLEPLPDGVEFRWCDLRTDPLPLGDFHAVVHLAALAGVRPSLNRPLDYLATNVQATVRLLEHCRKFGIGRFVFASSSSVYGPDTPLPAEESATPSPQSPYALTKLQCEQWGALYAKLHGLNFTALRFFSVWGPGQRADLALEAFRRRIEAGEPVTIFGDGTQRRDLTHVSDVAQAVVMAVQRDGSGAVVLNVGTGRNHSVMDMLEAAKNTVVTLQFSGSNFTHLTPSVSYNSAHPADVPETLASIAAVGKSLVGDPGFSSLKRLPTT